MKGRRVVGIFVLAALAAGCDSEPQPEETTKAAVAREGKTAAEKAVTADPFARMARAVTPAGKPSAAVELKYDFAARPAAGQPAEVRLALLPTAAAESLSLVVSGMQGLAVSGNLSPGFADIKAGEPLEHAFTATPETDGIYYATIIVTVQRGGAVTAQTFSLPLLVAAQEQAPATAVEAKDQNAGTKPSAE